MKRVSFLTALTVFAVAIATAKAEDPKPRPRGGFDRPLADTPRFGNPGASPKLTMVDFRALLEHWADFDANKNQLLEKSEVPELFGKLFDEADLNHDGVLDEHERTLVTQSATTNTTTATTTTVPVSAAAK
ncbi:hypothetical protein CfE428DRAFT_1615 [Chthoniobacter flavus Ellin428]|uniref:EF-hand domain-containing protein n=1 Tax=Chthoniobacter flavus Ellin428 TaxID=497964 RepID=B4CX02_9BACT|nr:hypothetical protein [Chthoniobacter flavus]EDY21322.1 hypothetical protein CfE428DRAFT_1615 [Chthoniobacter flavus Ellin428]TCO84909.1 hypothetical protein EV701_13329 [Chthoniobacter flavus]